MAGNVWELGMDFYAEDYYKNSPTKNPTGPIKGTKRMGRGGSWSQHPGTLRLSTRTYFDLGHRSPEFGFRCVIDVDANENPTLNPEGKIWNGN